MDLVAIACDAREVPTDDRWRKFEPMDVHFTWRLSAAEIDQIKKGADLLVITRPRDGSPWPAPQITSETRFPFIFNLDGSKG